MSQGFDPREFLDCSCQRLRRAARDATRLYDRHLESTGLGAGGIGILARLLGASMMGSTGERQSELADLIGVDQSTLSRNLKLLARQGLLTIRPDALDRRMRIVSITAKGRARLDQVAPLWRAAQAELKKTLGAGTLGQLDRLLDRSIAAFAD